MQDLATLNLAPLFQAVGDALRQNQGALNQADEVNGNHGDHMVEIFDLAARVAQEKGGADLAATMEQAGCELEQQSRNGSAQVYAHGLQQLAAQFRRYNVSLEDLVACVRQALLEQDESSNQRENSPAVSGDVLKALMAGIAAWTQLEAGKTPRADPLDMSALFEFGIAYLQARGRGGARAEVLADAAASVSPLSNVPYRSRSGKLAIQALLQAMKTD